MRRQSAPERRDRLLSSCDPGDPDSVVTTVVDAVAELRGEPPESLAPLDRSVDGEALADLFAPRHGGGRRGPGRVDFAYAGCTVTLTADGDVVVARR